MRNFILTYIKHSHQHVLKFKNEHPERFSETDEIGLLLRDFSLYLRGPSSGPCPNTKYPIFSQFDQKKNSLSENKFKKFSIIIINFFFIWMFFHYMTICNVLKYWDTFQMKIKYFLCPKIKNLYSLVIKFLNIGTPKNH